MWKVVDRLDMRWSEVERKGGRMDREVEGCGEVM